MAEEQQLLLRQLARLLDELGRRLDRMERGRRLGALAREGFVLGVARGLGSALGFSVLGALVLYLLRWTVVRNLPALGDLLARLLDLVELRRGLPPGP